MKLSFNPKVTRLFFAALSLVLLLFGSAAFARVEFELAEVTSADFNNAEKLTELCSVAEASAFWCDQLDEPLTLITTKGTDYFFNSAGEIVALFAKQQKGQDFGDNYNIDNRQNLIPYAAAIPGGAVLIEGEYLPPESAQASWERISDTEFQGTFEYRVGDLFIDKTIIVSNTSHTLEVMLELSHNEASSAEVSNEAAAEAEPTAEEGQEAATTETTEATDGLSVQYAFPGIARTDDPLIKIGQGDSFQENPGSQPVPNPSYISVQTSQRSTGYALILLPEVVAGDTPLAALALAGNIISLQRELVEANATTTFNVDVYGGAHELVRYYQEGYLDLPGLFDPNILGRLSLGLLAVLGAIHNVVGSWGLSIIVLTLLFRLLVWPLITTQTKSMVGMQKLQPKLKELQKKHKDDREKLTQETMKLYQEAGVNPAGGCLPILVQMPLFIILWRVFANFEFSEGFLWIPDLGLPDPYYILPILYVGVMVGQSFLMSRGNPQSLKQQLLINVVFVFFIINFPAGVTLYWVVSMLVQVFQHWLIQRNAAEPAKALKSKG